MFASVSNSFIPNKNKETIWIAIYGSLHKILIDSGSKFANN